MRCVVCSGRIEAPEEEDPDEPFGDGGTYFITYGGTVTFDPSHASYLEIYICEDCLLSAAASGDVMHATVTDADVTFEVWRGLESSKRH